MINGALNKLRGLNLHIWLTGVFIVLMAFSIGPVDTIYAGSAQEDICVAAGNKWDNGTCTTVDGEVTVNDAITAVVNVLSMIVGVVSVIMIIIGGFRFVTSGGDPASTKSAKNTILYAIVGLIVVAIAQAIVWFVLQSAVATPPPPTP